MKNHSEHVATENSNWYQHVSTCLNHMTAVLREKTSLVKIVPSCHLRVGPLESEACCAGLLGSRMYQDVTRGKGLQ